MSASYRIADEPQPSHLSRITVNPVWPLFAMMFAGPMVSWCWFIINGWAMGSPSQKKEIKTSLLGFVGAMIIVFVVFLLAGQKVLQPGWIPYALIGLTLWKLGVSYQLYRLQATAFSLFEYFHGKTRNGVLGVVAGVVLIRTITLDSPFWTLVLL
jgi:hypothetical protein